MYLIILHGLPGLLQQLLQLALLCLKEDVADDDIDALLKTIEDTNGQTLQSEHSGGSDGRSPIYVEHR